MKISFSSMFVLSILSSVLLPAISCDYSGCKESDAPMTAAAGNPWLIRYFIHVDDLSSLKIGMEVIEEILEEDMRNGQVRSPRPSDHLFAPTLAVHLPPIGFAVQEIGIVEIEFDRSGRVTTENTRGVALQGAFDDLHTFVLAPQSAEGGPPYRLASRFRGWSDPMAEFSPAFCTVTDDIRYRKGFDASKFGSIGNFGCREWSYQLLDESRPYIDVTSYGRKGASIKEFYGWAPFDGPRKPVIGKHVTTWVCMLDCPKGASPGIIADILKWCKENGYPVPQRPRKTPMFPDADFPYDYEE
ncbi:MAG TPA: hypothetical protein VGC21_07850 [Telluria sp.]|jgi:hypothetical protein